MFLIQEFEGINVKRISKTQLLTAVYGVNVRLGLFYSSPRSDTQLLITFESARSAKINEDGEITASLAWKNCQGVLIDPKTVVTTADCATYMPYTSMFQLNFKIY